VRLDSNGSKERVFWRQRHPIAKLPQPDPAADSGLD